MNEIGGAVRDGLDNRKRRIVEGEQGEEREGKKWGEGRKC